MSTDSREEELRLPSSAAQPSEIKLLTAEEADELGVPSSAFETLCRIVGRAPTLDELSTLLAMWKSSGTRQSLSSWLRGQPLKAEAHDYLYDATGENPPDIKEPRVKDCVDIAHAMHFSIPRDGRQTQRGDAIYMVGDVSTLFLDSEYARQFLHLVSQPLASDASDEAEVYIDLILSSLLEQGIVHGYSTVRQGGIFGTLVAATAPDGHGFDVLSYREVRLDSFLFGEGRGRMLAFFAQEQEDLFVRMMTEARLNCCLLGKVTKGRVLVDDMDFGPISDFMG
ncbi:MAG: hypothetical protein IJ684_01910 [Bacteroidales bacterium]|nr:hypothetical protein [Bacteroidales bacterium]